MNNGNGYDSRTMLSRIVEREANAILSKGAKEMRVELALAYLAPYGQQLVLAKACETLGIEWGDYEREVFRAAKKESEAK